MRRDTLWGATFLLFLLISVVTLTTRRSTAHSAPPLDVIINEWSQGNGGAKEWVELLVVNGPLDLRGWDLGDETAGDLTFSNDSVWETVNSGTLIVVYRGTDPDTVLPNDTVDVCNNLIVAPHNDSALFSGNFPSFSNSNSADLPVIRDASDGEIHNYGTSPTTPHAGSNEAVSFQNGSTSDVENSANWLEISAATASPGAGNSSANSAWIGSLQTATPTQADITVSASGTAYSEAGEPFDLMVSIKNQGCDIASNTELSINLGSYPIDYVSDTASITPTVTGQFVSYSFGSMQPGENSAFDITLEPSEEYNDSVEVLVSGTTTSAEISTDNNSQPFRILIGNAFLINAVHYHAYATDDEAVNLWNLGSSPLDISGWQISDGSSTATIPDGTELPAQAQIWIANDHDKFFEQFGFSAELDATDLNGSWPGYSNNGDEVHLITPDGIVVDTLVYESGSTTALGWSGAAVQPYAGGSLPTSGQILYRKLDQLTGKPVPDTNTSADWAQDPNDPINGSKIRFPGWDLDQFFFTRQSTESAELTIAIAPDNSFKTVKSYIDSATASLQIQTLIFTNLQIMNALIDAANRGVAVDLMMEGSPPGGLLDQQRYLCQQLENAGGNCWFSINEASQKIYDRYRFMHAKFIIKDGSEILISSDNFTGSSFPYDDFSDGTSGRRGVLMITDAPTVVDQAQQIWSADFDPTNHREIFPWSPNDALYGNQYGLPPAGFIPDDETGGMTYTVKYDDAAIFTGTFDFEVVQSPENSLRNEDALIGLVNRAGTGDTIYVQQLNERPHWGPSASNPSDDPNPRLEAYIEAARRGAKVRLLLDEYHIITFYNPDDPPDNEETCQYVNNIASSEGLQMKCRLGLPVDLGIHNKMVLAEIDGKGYVHGGSINGTEQSSKGNRELALQIQSDGAYALLSQMFLDDWPNFVYLPILGAQITSPTDHAIISEILYNPSGPNDDAEFIEIANPTSRPINISSWRIGDTQDPNEFEDVRIFPNGTSIPPGGTVVVTFSAVAYFGQFGQQPNFEIFNSNPAIPDLVDDPAYPQDASLQLGNMGDEVFLLNAGNQIIDVVTYGASPYPGFSPVPAVTLGGSSLERFPYWQDTDSPSDFREQTSPSPNHLP